MKPSLEDTQLAILDRQESLIRWYLSPESRSWNDHDLSMPMKPSIIRVNGFQEGAGAQSLDTSLRIHDLRVEIAAPLAGKLTFEDGENALNDEDRRRAVNRLRQRMQPVLAAYTQIWSASDLWQNAKKIGNALPAKSACAEDYVPDKDKILQ